MTDVLQGMIVERQRLLIREANYLRGLVGLPPVRAEKECEDESAARGPWGGRGYEEGR